MAVSTLLARLKEHLARSALFPEAGLAVLAVSGGADSVAMLDVFSALKSTLGLDLLLAHADHGIAQGSAEVADRVRALARSRYDLDTVVGTLGLGPTSTETRARGARYRFLRAVQEARGARYLLTAHHADDQIETVLLRVLKGSAPAGLAGIRPTGPRGLVRPLLPYRRRELLAHVETRGLPVVHDPANVDPRHLRSWVRTVLMPLLDERLGERAASHLLVLAGHAADEVAAWDALLDTLPELEPRARAGRFDVARGPLSGYDNVLAGRILRAAARRAGFPLSPRAASRLARFAREAASGRRLLLGSGWVAEAAFERLLVEASAGPPDPVVLRGDVGAAPFGRYMVRWRREPAPERVPRAGWTTWVAAEGLAVRPVRVGDRLVPLGGVGRRKVARVLMESRVPRAERAAYPIIVAEGRVVWVPGVCRGLEGLPDPGMQAVRIDVGSG